MDESLPHESVLHLMKLRKRNNTSDESLIVAFESLFHEYWAPIYRLLLGMVIDPSEAEDLALETFLRLYKHHPVPEAEFNTRGWLQRVAANLALQSIRSFKRREQYELNAGKDALEQAPQHQPPEIMAEKEDQRFVRLALAQMNERQAELLVMRHSGLAYKEIAQALNLAPTSMGPLLLRAEREFEKQYRALTKEKP
ncbi:MAG: sigma-70 family RNA polymerase sigma factor [Chloroflexota bacterium]